MIEPHSSAAVYDCIGPGYPATRRADPRIEAQIHAALRGATSVVNVGAGTGNYEPRDRLVVAADPSLTMLAQRPLGLGRAVQARAEALPFRDRSFDAALATFTLHHWSDPVAGLAELRRVAWRQVVLLNEPSIGHAFWLADYFPEALTLASGACPPQVAGIETCLDVIAVEPVPVPADCTDGFAGAYWSRPHAYLDPGVRRGMSVLARLPSETIQRGVDRLVTDLCSGEWDRRYGHLRRLATYDVGYRLVVAGR